MKNLISPLILIFVLSACKQPKSREYTLQNQIDSLQTKLDNAYKPGFGDFMGNIQNHHNKLWFAGLNENWELAAFEMHEIEEVFEDIKMTHPNRAETELLPMVDSGFVEINKAINQENKEVFKKGYLTLTNACNTCHQATEHEFIAITIPTIPSYSNQDFKRNPQN